MAKQTDKNQTIWESLSETKEGAENILKYTSLLISLLLAFGQSWLKDLGIENPGDLEFWQIVSMTLPLNLTIFVSVLIIISFDLDHFLGILTTVSVTLLVFTWLGQNFLPETAIDLNSALEYSKEGGIWQRMLAFVLAAGYMYFEKYGFLNFFLSIGFGVYFAYQWKKIEEKHF